MANREVLNVTQRELARMEIADQVEMFLQRGGRIDVLNGPSAGERDAMGRVWWEVGGNLRGAGPLAGAGI